MNPSRKLVFSWWPRAAYHRSRPPGENHALPWSEWVVYLTTHERRGAAIQASFWRPPSTENADQNDRSRALAALEEGKKGPGIVLGEMRQGGQRTKKNIVLLDALGLDIDHGSDPDIMRIIQICAPFEYACYSTHKHSFLGQSRLRLIFPLKRPISPDEFPFVWEGFNVLTQRFGDQQTKDAARFFYLPSAAPHAPILSRHNQGEWLDPDQWLIHKATAPLRRKPEAKDFDAEVFRVAQLARKMPAEDPLHAPMTALLAGQAFALPGDRHDTMLRLTGWIAGRTQDAKLSENAIVTLFTPGLLASSTPDSPAEGPEAAVVAYEGAWQKIKEAHRARALAVQRNPNESGYSPEELAAIAKAQRTTPDQLEKRWLLSKHPHCWFLDSTGSYQGPFFDKDAIAAAPDFLRRAPVRFLKPTKDGLIPRPLTQVILESGSVVTKVVADLRAQTSYYDAANRTLYSATCPRRKFEAKQHPQIGEWLRLLGGEDTAKLERWLAYASDLSKTLCALYFAGQRETGKTLFAHGVASFWTDGPPTDGSTFFTSRFNDSITRVPVIFVDEQRPSMPRGQTMTAMLRSEVTTLSRLITQKYRDPYEAQGAVRIILAANNEDLLASEAATREDNEAIAEKVLILKVGETVAKFLRDIPLETKEEWKRTSIAEHAQWLFDTRYDERVATRLQVMGNHTQSHRAILVSTEWTKHVCEWAVRYLIAPQAVDQKRDRTAKREPGLLLLNTKGVADNFTLYLPAIKPNTSEIGNALRSLACLEVLRDGIPYFQIDLDNLRAWAQKYAFVLPDFATMASNYGKAP